MRGLVCILLALVVGGCTTGGPVIGPFSYVASQSNERGVLLRSVNNSKLEPAKKEQLFKAMQVCGDARGIVVGLGVDVFALAESQMTGMEMLKSATGAIGDTLLYSGVIVGAGKVANSLSNANSGNGTIVINGNVTHSSVNTVQGNTSPVTINQSTTRTSAGD